MTDYIETLSFFVDELGRKGIIYMQKKINGS